MIRVLIYLSLCLDCPFLLRLYTPAHLSRLSFSVTFWDSVSELSPSAVIYKETRHVIAVSLLVHLPVCLCSPRSSGVCTALCGSGVWLTLSYCWRHECDLARKLCSPFLHVELWVYCAAKVFSCPFIAVLLGLTIRKGRLSLPVFYILSTQPAFPYRSSVLSMGSCALKGGCRGMARAGPGPGWKSQVLYFLRTQLIAENNGQELPA